MNDRHRAATRDSGRLLIAVNLIPVFGVFVLDWEIFPLILLYWLENVMLGVLQVVRIALAPIEHSTPKAAATVGKLFFIPFFTAHFGIFCLVHGVFVFMVFSDGSPFDHMASFPTPRVVLRAIAEYHLWIPALALFASHAFSLVRHLAAGEPALVMGPNALGEVYGRVVVLHLAILFGGFFALLFQSNFVPLLLLIALKTSLDHKAHMRKHEKAATS